MAEVTDEHDDHEKVPVLADSGLRLDLRRADLGHPDRPGLWDELHHNCHVGVLICAACAPDSPHRFLYLCEHNGHRAVREYSRGQVAAFGLGESDTHRALKDKISLLAQRQGLSAVQECANPARSRRTDVVISGGQVDVGWEVQLSSLKPQGLRRRITRAETDGLVSSWLTMSGTTGFNAVIDRAPACSTKSMQSNEIAAAEDVRIFQGLKRLQITRCTHQRTERWHRRLECTGYHARPAPLENDAHPTLDQMISLSAAGDVVTIRWPRTLQLRNSRPWLWVPRADASEFYEVEAPSIERLLASRGPTGFDETAAPGAAGAHAGAVVDMSDDEPWRHGITASGSILRGAQCRLCGWTRDQHHPRCEGRAAAP